MLEPLTNRSTDWSYSNWANWTAVYTLPTPHQIILSKSIKIKNKLFINFGLQYTKQNV